MEFVCFLFIPLSTCVTDWCFLYPSLRRALFSSLTFITLLFVNEVKKKKTKSSVSCIPDFLSAHQTSLYTLYT